jgi:hypothetical protein
MKIPKKVTPAKLAANNQNAQKSPGPTSGQGKRFASRNAITHSFFAKELVLNDQDARRLKASARILHEQLSPQTEMQEIGFALIVTCIGRCKVALRQEMIHVTRTRMLGETTAPQVQSGSQDQAAGTEWFLSGKQALRDGIKLIEAVRAEYEQLGRIDPQWNASLDKTFGSRFRQLLTEWPSSDKELVLFGHFLVEHARRYNLPMPSLVDPPASDEKREKPPEVILDPEQNRGMVLKLLQLEEDVLSDLWKSLQQRSSDSARAQGDAADFDPLYFPKACRDLERAVKWYRHLKKEKL